MPIDADKADKASYKKKILEVSTILSLISIICTWLYMFSLILAPTVYRRHNSQPFLSLPLRLNLVEIEIDKFTAKYILNSQIMYCVSWSFSSYAERIIRQTKTVLIWIQIIYHNFNLEAINTFSLLLSLHYW